FPDFGAPTKGTGRRISLIVLDLPYVTAPRHDTSFVSRERSNRDVTRVRLLTRLQLVARDTLLLLQQQLWTQIPVRFLSAEVEKQELSYRHTAVCVPQTVSVGLVSSPVKVPTL
ncbi:unnamed protein product, partial [Ectocarpus fasciculatus]